MLEDIANRQLEKNEPLIHLLERNADFFSLKPHLEDLAIKKIAADNSKYSETIEWHMRYEQRHPPSDDRHAALTTEAYRTLINEIGRIEKKWGLV